MDIDQEHLGIPDCTYDAEVTMSSSEFQKICRDLTTLGESVKIEVTKEGVRFSSEGEIGNASILLKAGSVNKTGGRSAAKPKKEDGDDDVVEVEDDDEDEDGESASKVVKKSKVKKEKDAEMNDEEVEGLFSMSLYLFLWKEGTSIDNALLYFGGFLVNDEDEEEQDKEDEEEDRPKKRKANGNAAASPSKAKKGKVSSAHLFCQSANQFLTCGVTVLSQSLGKKDLGRRGKPTGVGDPQTGGDADVLAQVPPQLRKVGAPGKDGVASYDR